MNRRFFLRSAAATLWLPFLPSALPRTAWAGETTAPRRMVYWFVPNGLHFKAFQPEATGSAAGVLSPMQDVWDRLSQVSGLRNRAIDDYSTHEAATASALSDQRISLGGALNAGVSVDQVAALAIGSNTPVPSLQLGLREPGILTGGNSGVYVDHISWGRDSRPLAKITSPRRLFGKIFAGADPVKTDESQSLRKSVLDAVLERANDLNRKLATDDKRKLDQYVTSVRQVEQSIERIEEFECPRPLTPPAGDQADFHLRYRAMADLTVLALQCDFTRIVTFMSGPSASYTVYKHLGLTQDHHTFSHATTSTGMADFMRIHEWHVAQMAETMRMMADIDEGGSDLLSNTMFTLFAEFGNPNVHYAGDMTWLLAGGESGGIAQGQHHDFGGVPHSNYHRTVLDFVGAGSGNFGQHATGSLDLS